MSNLSEPGSPKSVEPSRRGNAVVWGLILVALGIILLLQRLGRINEHFNWWAIFILIPALASFAGAWYAFQRAGRINAAVRSSIGGGLIVLTVALMFLFNLDWAIWWPLMLIVVGFSTFLNGFGATDATLGPGATGWVALGFWFGLSVMLLGLTFLLNNLGRLEPISFFRATNWWGIFIIIPGAGAIINSVWVFFRGGSKALIPAVGLLVIGVLIGIVGAVAYLSLNWQIINLLAPLALIIGGLAVILATLSRRQ